MYVCRRYINLLCKLHFVPILITLAIKSYSNKVNPQTQLWRDWALVSALKLYQSCSVLWSVGRSFYMYEDWYVVGIVIVIVVHKSGTQDGKPQRNLCKRGVLPLPHSFHVHSRPHKVLSNALK